MATLQEAWDRAMVEYRAGNLGTAETLLCQILAERDDWWEGCTALGAIYAQAQAYGRAIIMLQHAIRLNPKNFEAMANLAIVYRTLEKQDKAIEWNHRSLQIEPDNPVTLSNLAGAYVNAGSPMQALAWSNAALDRAPQMAEAGNHRALALLEMGRFEDGWAQYDARFGVAQWHQRPYTCPQWAGERTRLLAISGEQGLGDEVMFMTCIQQVRGMVDGILLEVSPRLVQLIQHSFPDIPVYGTCEALLAEHTPSAWTHMGSLPRQVWPVTPNVYLKPTRRYPRGTRRRIGISWRGGTMATHERLRNFQLDYWRHLVANLPGEVISLQYGERSADAKTLGVPHDAESIADLDTLAAMIASCDLVLTVCNTTVHLAGALGVPCITLVPSKPAWRYGISGERMPWYDSVQLLRQGKHEDWRSVVDRVLAATQAHFGADRAAAA